MAPREADDPAPDDALPADAGAGSGGDGRDPRRVPVVLERFAGYLLGGGPVEVADLGAAVADLGESACIEVAAAAQALLARTAYLQDRACAAAQDAEADRDGDDPDPATRYAGRFARSAVIAELATACRLSEGAIWWRVHRSQDLAHLLPGTQARAAAGALGPARVDAVRDKTRDLTPAARHRLDEVIAGRADPLTADEHADPPTQALRPLRGNELATPRRFDNAITRRVTHLSRQTHHATAAPADNPDATTSSDATSSGGDDADSDTTSSGDATSGGGDDAGHPARYTGVNLDHGDNGQGYLTICGPITSLLVVKSALYAADRQGHDVVDTLLTWATHALAGITPPGGTGPTPRPHVLVTVPLATLTGQGDVPAELDRYGPLPTDLLDQVWAQATIRCGVVDPTGTLLALGHPTHTQAYTPPPRLRRFVTIAWVHCAFPGCDKPAATCQLDHTQPWPHGETCQCNLAPLCPLHHNLKTHAGWSYTLATGTDHPPGTLEWTSPTGRTHHSEPGLPEITSWWPTPPTTQHHRPHPRPGPAPQPPHPPVDHDQPPPF